MAFKIKLPNSTAGTDQGSKAAGQPLLGRLTYANQLRLMIGCVAASLLSGIITTALDYRTSSNSAHYLELSAEMQLLTQRSAKDALFALQGKQTALDDLQLAHKEMERILQSLDKGDEIAPAVSGEPRTALEQLKTTAAQSMQYLKEVEAGRPGILATAQSLDKANKLVTIMRALAGQLPSSSAVENFSLLTERIGYETNSMQDMVVTDQMITALTSDIGRADTLLSGFDKNNPVVIELSSLYKNYRDSVSDLIKHSDSMKNAKFAAEKYFDSVSYSKNGAFISASAALKKTFESSHQGRWTTYLMALSAILLLSFLWLLSRVYLAEARHRASIAEANTKLNQHAILRLMNELSDLAEGDLTVRATVTEDITGAVADSVNYTTEELHKLVSRITEAAEQMGMATRDSEEMAQRLLTATQMQVKEITSAEESVKLISRSISEVDTAAIKAAEVGRHTLAATNQGSVAVRNTISGMNDIREHIQETSKRIKRLGESSQEIGEIVDLISDITEQTNVLALNAAIQAASAGDAGRGFSVVAEEVQRLAERSGEATKQIAALVKTIQSDTQDAVAAMEKSTLGVVEGAKLSEVAGQSLKEIEVVSNELAALINSISVSTQVQTEMADEVSTVMQDIMSISKQTTEGTRLTSDSAARLTSLAASLKGSVATFKL